MMFNCVFITFCGILGQVWYLIVSIPNLCHLSYFHKKIAIGSHKSKQSFSVLLFWCQVFDAANGFLKIAI